MAEKHTLKALATAGLLVLLLGLGNLATAQTVKDFVSVDAARYQLAVTPNSIAAGFTNQVTTQTAFATDADAIAPGIQLPTELGGIRLTVNGRLAGLLAVTPNQINYLVPAETETNGPATVVVMDETGTVVAQGTLNMVSSMLSIFTANFTGFGAPAALATPDGISYTVVGNPDGSSNVVPAGQFLVLFGTGIRGSQQDVKAFIGGIEAPVTYVGDQPDFLGLSQVNVQIPASLANQGLLDLVLTEGSATSNAVTIDLGGNPTAPPNAPVITSLSTTTATAGQIVTLTGSNFATTLEEARVRIGSTLGQVVSTSATSMSFIVPYGAATAKVVAGNAAGERQSNDTLNIITSISGTLTTALDEPIPGMPVRVAGTTIATSTDTSGRFLLVNVPAGVAQVEIDATGTPYASLSFSMLVTIGRDNEAGSIALLQDIGNELLLAGEEPEGMQSEGSTNETPTPRVIEHNGLRLEIPGKITFPNGSNTGRLKLTRIEADRRLPILLPAGVYPSVIALITPLGTRFGEKDGTDSATLIFPNPDQLPAGSSVDLYAYRFNVAPSAFVKKGTATVSSDGTKITAAGLIDVATLYFIGIPADNAPITKVTGTVVDANDKPVHGARVHVRGRGAATDKEGKFVIEGVRAQQGSELEINVAYITPAGVPLKASKKVTAVVPGETNAGTIKLPPEPPLIVMIRPTEVKIQAGGTADMKVVLSKPLPEQITIHLTKDEGVELTINPTTVTIAAGETGAGFTVSGSTPGKATISARLAAAIGGITPAQTRNGFAIVYVLAPAPTLSSITPAEGAPGSRFTLTGTGFASEPKYNAVFFKQGDYVVPVDPGTIKVSGSTTLEGTVPRLRAGEAEVYLVVFKEHVPSARSNGLRFTVTTPSAPVLNSITPAEGAPRTTFKITGTGFAAEARHNAVFFKLGDRIFPAEPSQLKVIVAASSPPTEPTDNTITGPATIEGLVPVMPAGDAEVFVVVYQENTPSAKSNALPFKVKPLPTPVLESITPSEGVPGTAFTLKGRGFEPDPKRTYVFFRQGDHAFMVEPSSLRFPDQNTIEGRVPRMPAGAAEVYVVAGYENLVAASSNKLAFTVKAPPAPVLESITPNEGTPGTAFKIKGTGFSSEPRQNAVFFKQGDKITPVNPETLKVGDNTIEGIVPEMAAGAAEVYVVVLQSTLQGAKSNALAFTVKARTTNP
jgi:uncharacterized protein (TIGR03437 family)